MLAVKNKIMTAEKRLRGKKRAVPIKVQVLNEAEKHRKTNLNHPWVNDKTYTFPK